MKELEELLSSFIENNEELKEKLIDLSAERLAKAMERASREKVELSVKNSKKGNAEVVQQGSAMGKLMCLALLEKSVLENVNCPNIVFDIIKDVVEDMTSSEENE